MGVLRTLLRFFSYLFHGLLALLLLAISSLTLITGGNNLHLGMLPWTGSTLTLVVFFGSLFGLVTLLLAIRGKLRALFFLWSLAVAVFMVKGYVLSSYHFAPGEARLAGYLMLGAILALAGAWFQIFRKVEGPGRY
ncbi:MAG TPA: hypothetical protein VKU19_01115 [Bryobacteraceae bacterium]|nr:hypothetical protein [Bryobacteraceae bacterium]